MVKKELGRSEGLRTDECRVRGGIRWMNMKEDELRLVNLESKVRIFVHGEEIVVRLGMVKELV